MRLSSNPFLAGLCVLGIGIAPAAARTVRIEAAGVRAPHVSLANLRVEVHLADAGGFLCIQAARLSVPDAALDGRVEWRCELRRDGDAQVCEGPLRVGDAREATLSARIAREAIVLALRGDGTAARIDIPFGAGAVSASVRQLPATWVAPFLASNWRGGDIDADARFDAPDRLNLRYDVRGLDLATRDGAFAANGVDASGTLDLDVRSGATAIAAQTRLARGRLDRPRDGAARRQPADPAAGRVRRPRRPDVPRARRPGLSSS